MSSLTGDERQIAELVLERLRQGRDTYGPWLVDDGRDYVTEALEEGVDLMQYLAAELIRLRRKGARKRLRRIYVCHPFSCDPWENSIYVRAICRRLVREGCVPVAPHLYLPQFVNESTERDQALELCLEMLASCDELRAYGGRITAGMLREIERAHECGIPVSFPDAEVA